MTIIQATHNTELRSMPFGRIAGYSPYRSSMDQAGRTGNIGGFGDLQTAERTHDIALNFHYGILADSAITSVVGTAEVDVHDSKLHISSQTEGTDAYVQSRSAILYQSGYDAQAMFTAKFTNYKGPASVTQHIGPYDGSNGYVIGADNGQLIVERYRDGVEIDKIYQPGFDFDKLDGTGVSGFKINIDKFNLFRIQYGYLGLLPPIFEVYGGPFKGWIPFHCIDGTNNSDFLIINNPYLPIRATIKINAGTPDIPIELESGSWYGGSLGGKREYSDLQFFSDSVSVPILAGIETPLIAIRNKDLFNGITNRQRLDVVYMSQSSDGNKSVAISGYAGPVLTGETWQEVDPGLSIVESSKDATGWTGGRYMGDIGMAKVDSKIMQFPLGQVRLNPGDVLLMTGFSTTASDLTFTVRWGEAR